LKWWLQNIRRGGDLDVSEQGRLAYICTFTGVQYDCTDPINTYTDIFERQRQYDAEAPDPQELYVVAASLCAEGVAELEIDAALDCLARMRASVCR